MTKHRLQTLWAVALAMGIAMPAVGQRTPSNNNTGYGTTSGEFLLLGAGARGAALGGAYSALATDVAALYYNAAGLAQLTRPGLMVSSYDYVADTRYTWIGLGFPFTGGVRAFGVSFGNFGFADQPIYTVDNPDGDGRTYNVNQSFLALTYSQNFSDRFSAGLTAKLIREKLGETSADAIAVDFGTNFHAMVGERPIRAAFVLANLGGGLQHQGAALDAGQLRTPPLGTPDVPQEPQPARLRSTAWPLPVIFRVAVAYDVLGTAQNRLTLLGEFNQPNNTKAGASLGLEWGFANLGNSGFALAARGSYAVQPDNQVSDIDFGTLPTSQGDGSFTSDGLALGGGIEYHKRNSDFMFGFDYAYRNMGALGGTNFLSFSVGW